MTVSVLIISPFFGRAVITMTITVFISAFPMGVMTLTVQFCLQGHVNPKNDPFRSIGILFGPKFVKIIDN